MQSTVSETGLTRRQERFILFGLLVGVFAEALESSIVYPALPSMGRLLPGSSAWMAWVYGAYLLPITALTPIYGRLSDVYGRLPLYTWGIVLFMLGSILSGFSTSLPMLVAFRCIQGVGAGALMPIAIIIGRTVFPMSKRGQVQGIIAMSFGIAAALGPALGGFVTKTLSWHWLFFLNVPFCIASLSLMYLFLPMSARHNPDRPQNFQVDWLGALTLIIGSGSLMLALTWIGKSDHGTVSLRSIIALATSLLGFVLFLLAERRHPQPMVPLHLFRRKVFSLCALGGFFAGGLMLSVNMHLPLYMQEVFHVNEAQSGMFVTPMILSTVVGSFLGGRLLGRKIKKYKWMAVFSSGVMLMGLGLLSIVQPDTTLWKVVFAGGVFGCGMGISFPLYGTVIGQQVEPKQLGAAFGLLAFSRSLGGAVSSALFGSLFIRKFDHVFTLQLKQLLPVDVLATLPLQRFAEPHFRSEWITSHKEALPAVCAALEKSSFLGHAQAIHRVFVVACLVAGASLLVSALLPNERIDLTGRPTGR